VKSVAIIPARGGSTRIPGKNKRMFHGKPIICYSIETAKKSNLFDLVCVSTDDDEIAKISVEAGASVLLRPAELAKNEVGTQEVMAAALVQLQIAQQVDSIVDYEFACCIYPTAPLLSWGDLMRAYMSLLMGGIDYVVPVGTWLRDPGQFYFGRVGAFLGGVPLLGYNTKLLPISPATDCDINTQEDWDRAEKMYLALKESNGQPA
jgi:N-acylneuraminate cytidylyltransferase